MNDYPELPGDQNAKTDVESGDYELHRKIGPGDLVLDLGAHVGFFTQLASDKVGYSGQVIAFEPDNRNYALLKAGMSVWNNIVTYPLAAWDENQTVRLWHNLENTGGHSLFQNEQHFGSAFVPAINIGAFVWGMPIKPDFIKIDTEGAEHEIICSLMTHCGIVLTGKQTHIAVEVHTEPIAEKLSVVFKQRLWNFRAKNSTVGLWYADAPV